MNKETIAQIIIDRFFTAGARISKQDYTFVLAMLDEVSKSETKELK